MPFPSGLGGKPRADQCFQLSTLKWSVFVFDFMLAECGMGSFAVVDYSSARQLNEPGFHLVKFAGGQDVIVARRKHLEFCFSTPNAIVVHRMRGEGARDES